MKKLFIALPFFLSSCYSQEVSVASFNSKKENFIDININNPCSKIVYKQVLKKYKRVLQKRKIKSSSYTFSLSILGPSFSFSFNPYLDEKEIFSLKLKIAEDIEKYSKNLEEYLITLRKYLFSKKFYKWEKARIKTGVDSVKENFSDIKDYEYIYSKVKAMEIKYDIYNIKKDELYKCYLYTYKNKVTNPFDLIKRKK